MRTTKMFASCAALLVLYTATAARAADPDLAAAARAYVESDTVAKNVLGLMHTGADYTGCDALGVYKVTNGGKVVPGEFAVKVRLNWAYSRGDKDWTEVNYFFNADGRFTDLSTGDTTAIISQPFAVGGLAVEVIKAALLDNLKGKREEKTWAPIIKQADAKTLTEIGLKLGQP